MIKFSVIIPTYRNSEILTKCLQAVRRTTGPETEIIVVSNDTDLGTASAARKVKATLLNSDNESYSKSCNAGARAAKGDYLVFLNDDTVPAEGWLDRLYHGMKQLNANG